MFGASVASRTFQLETDEGVEVPSTLTSTFFQLSASTTNYFWFFKRKILFSKSPLHPDSPCFNWFHSLFPSNLLFVDQQKSFHMEPMKCRLCWETCSSMETLLAATLGSSGITILSAPLGEPFVDVSCADSRGNVWLFMIQHVSAQRKSIEKRWFLVVFSHQYK